jgi:hypothetical protein
MGRCCQSGVGTGYAATLVDAHDAQDTNATVIPAIVKQ